MSTNTNEIVVDMNHFNTTRKFTPQGHTHAGRVGKSILQHAGLADWIADDRECYVKKAIGMATQRETLQTLRRTLRQHLQSSSLCDHAGFAQKFEAALKALL